MTTNNVGPQWLYLMQVARLPQVNAPFVCYLVQMSDGTNVLIDSGFPEEKSSYLTNRTEHAVEI